MTTKEIEDKKLSINDIVLIKLAHAWIKREKSKQELKSDIQIWEVDVQFQTTKPVGKGWKKLPSVTGAYVGDNYKQGENFSHTEINLVKVRPTEPFAMKYGYISIAPSYMTSIQILQRNEKTQKPMTKEELSAFLASLSHMGERSCHFL